MIVVVELDVDQEFVDEESNTGLTADAFDQLNEDLGGWVIAKGPYQKPGQSH